MGMVAWPSLELPTDGAELPILFERGLGFNGAGPVRRTVAAYVTVGMPDVGDKYLVRLVEPLGIGEAAAKEVVVRADVLMRAADQVTCSSVAEADFLAYGPWR